MCSPSPHVPHVFTIYVGGGGDAGCYGSHVWFHHKLKCKTAACQTITPRIVIGYGTCAMSGASMKVISAHASHEMETDASKDFFLICVRCYSVLSMGQATSNYYALTQTRVWVSCHHQHSVQDNRQMKTIMGAYSAHYWNHRAWLLSILSSPQETRGVPSVDNSSVLTT